jgi:hypothetical protein
MRRKWKWLDEGLGLMGPRAFRVLSEKDLEKVIG